MLSYKLTFDDLIDKIIAEIKEAKERNYPDFVMRNDVAELLGQWDNQLREDAGLKELDDLREQVDDLEGDLEEARGEICEKDDEIGELKERVEELEKELDEAKGRIEELEGE